MDKRLYSDIERYLAEHVDRMARRQDFIAGMDKATWHDELWTAIAPFIKSPAQYRAGAAFMAAMLRDRWRE